MASQKKCFIFLRSSLSHRRPALRVRPPSFVARDLVAMGAYFRVSRAMTPPPHTRRGRTLGTRDFGNAVWSLVPRLHTIILPTATDPAPRSPFAAALVCTTPLTTRFAVTLKSRKARTKRAVSTQALLTSSRSADEKRTSESNPLFANVAKCVAAASVASVLVLSLPDPAFAELNAREAARGGEFNRGSAKQFGGYDLTNKDVVGEYGADLRLSNFTGAEMRKANLKGANLTGAYLMKAVAYAANFEGANLSDALMDRAVLNKANFKDAVLTRVVLTSSDLGDATIEGADFSDALIDVTQKNLLCKYAAGTNPTTGVQTRKSLNCGGSGRVSTPSRYMTDDAAAKPEPAFDASRFSSY